MERPTLVLLDLEETVVDDWQSRNFLFHKMERVKRFLEQFKPFTLGLMSWAVYDDADLRVFHDELEAENSLNLLFVFKLILELNLNPSDGSRYNSYVGFEL